jgi:hypothetical protein
MYERDVQPHLGAEDNFEEAPAMTPRFEIRREHLNLQARFGAPVFGLFKDFPELVEHLFRTLGGYGIRLTDIKLDSPGESLGEINLRFSWAELNTECRIFLDRVELASGYPPFPPFVHLAKGDLVRDILDSLASYSPDISFRAFQVMREFHGALDVPASDFLGRFSSSAPQSLGPSLGSGTIFYFGADANRLAGSLSLDFSRVVDDGLFLKLITLFDASQVAAADLLPTARTQLVNLVAEMGIELAEV